MATKRTHPLEFKRSAVGASNQPGASIAGVAMAHGINANQLHKWRRQLRGTELIVAKQRHGATGKVRLRFEARITRFSDLAEDALTQAYDDDD